MREHWSRWSKNNKTAIELRMGSHLEKNNDGVSDLGQDNKGAIKPVAGACIGV